MPMFPSKGVQGRKHTGASSSSTDGRTGLGYGVWPKHHVPKQTNDSFPYTDPDDYADLLDDIELDDETVDAVHRKANTDYVAVDSMAANRTDPFYFAAGNTKLSDCFERPDDILEEVFATGKSISPVPSLYKSRARHDAVTHGSATGGGFTRTGNLRRTGTKQGFSHAPPRVDVDDDLVPVDVYDAIDSAPIDYNDEDDLALVRAKAIEKMFKN